MPDPRKVIILGSAYPLRGGGISTFNERLARAFQDSGDDVTIYNFSLQYPGFLFPGKTQYSDESPPDDLNIITRVNSVNPLNWVNVGKEIRKLKPDMLIIRYWIPFMAPCLGTIARYIRKNKHTRIIAITDNVIPHEKRIGDTMLTKYFVKRMHGFVTMSKSVLKDLELFDTEKPRAFCAHPLYDNFGDIIPKAEAKEMLQLDQDKRYILFFGFIRDYKGLDLLLKAFADERLRAFPLKLLVAGEFYTNPEPYHELIRSSGIENLVTMDNEFIPNAAVAKYFCASDLVVQPYKDATQSGVTQIAYHFDKPMVVSNVGALPEMVPDGKVGYVVAPEVKQIADAILTYFRDAKEGEFTENVRVEKKKYAWENMINAINTLI
ncbi:MAG: glycosyltransferase [Bacteroidota bacterium]|nr:glycosyltransferase [Bacteroidota bacterium]